MQKSLREQLLKELRCSKGWPALQEVFRERAAMCNQEQRAVSPALEAGEFKASALQSRAREEVWLLAADILDSVLDSDDIMQDDTRRSY